VYTQLNPLPDSALCNCHQPSTKKPGTDTNNAPCNPIARRDHHKLRTLEDYRDRHHTIRAVTVHPVPRTARDEVPSWLRPNAGEHRWQMAFAVSIAIALQAIVPNSLAFHPRWVMPALEGALLLFLAVANPGRITGRSPKLRAVAVAMVVAINFANFYSLVLLIHGLVEVTESQSAPALLMTGAAIWGTNVIAFSFWYWEFDRGGPGARANAVRHQPDLLFPQMTAPDFAPSDWQPEYFDYLYTSFTNATAFSPTDTMPLTRWTKMLFLIQSGVSLVTGALVVARAVNILH
jgi:uncharacterized membrane protein